MQIHQLEEEAKRVGTNPQQEESVINIGRVMKIDLANDPVTRSLLEVHQDECKLAIQRVYLSKQC